jgi:hypothetical protein
MAIARHLTTRVMGIILALLMVWTPQMAVCGTGPAKPDDGQSAQPQPAAADKALSVSLQELPDSPSAVRQQQIELAQQETPASQSPASQTPATQAPATQAPADSPPTAKPSSNTTRPVGTAAAEAPPSSGVAASEPAGTAIAPAKQRQVRSLLIKLGALLGAGAAVGTVMALSSATSSKPPGSH